MDDFTGAKNQYNKTDDPYGIGGLDDWDDFGLPSTAPADPVGQAGQPVSPVTSNTQQQASFAQSAPLMPNQTQGMGGGNTGAIQNSSNSQTIGSGSINNSQNNTNPNGMATNPYQANNQQNLNNQNASLGNYGAQGLSPMQPVGFNNSQNQVLANNAVNNDLDTNLASNNYPIGSTGNLGVGVNSVNPANDSSSQDLSSQNMANNAGQQFANSQNSVINNQAQVGSQSVQGPLQAQSSTGITGANLLSSTLSDHLDDKDDLQGVSSGLTPEIASSSDSFKIEQGTEDSKELQESKEIEQKIEAVSENLNKQQVRSTPQAQTKPEETKKTEGVNEVDLYTNVYGYAIPKDFSTDDSNNTKDLTDGAYWLHILIKRLQLMRMTQS